MDKKSTLFSTPIAAVCNAEAKSQSTGSENAPSEQVIQNILNYSKALQVVKATPLSNRTEVKSVCMVLN